MGERSLYITAFIYFANILDAAATHYYIQNYPIIELNPFMNSLISHGWYHFWIFKIIVPLAFLCFLFHYRQYLLARTGLYFLACIFTSLSIYHLIIFYITHITLHN